MACLLCGKTDHSVDKCPSRSVKLRINEQNYLAALNQPVVMAPALLSFVRKIFNNTTIMNPKTSAKQRSDLIYALYSGDDAVTGPQSDEKEIIKKIAQIASVRNLLDKGAFQNTNLTLEMAYNTLNAGGDIHADNYSDFLYFSGVGNGHIAVRLYLNVDVSSMAAMMELIAQYPQIKPNHGIRDFKLAGPRAAVGRADTFVIYCVSPEAARQLAVHLVKTAGKSGFKNAVPEMTTRLEQDLGVSIGAEPKWQGTGMSFDKSAYNAYRKRHFSREDARRYAEIGQSFGSIRSQLIAMAIENYHDNKSRLNGSDFERFQKFVSVAFKGYGLDPAKPGN
jgi:hypothetical protein